MPQYEGYLRPVDCCAPRRWHQFNKTHYHLVSHSYFFLVCKVILKITTFRTQAGELLRQLLSRSSLRAPERVRRDLVLTRPSKKTGMSPDSTIFYKELQPTLPVQNPDGSRTAPSRRDDLPGAALHPMKATPLMAEAAS